MPAPSGIGVAEVSAFLRDHFDGAVESVEVVGEGEWSRAFGFRAGARDLVIRVGAHVSDFEKDRRAAGFAAPALPVPAVTDIGTALGCFYAISTRAYGEPLEQLDAPAWDATVPALFAALDAIRAVDISDTTGYGLWEAPFPTWRDYLRAVERDTPEQRTHGWRQKLTDSVVGDTRFVAGVALLRELTENLADQRYLVHCDLINRNVLVAEGRITAVFDWGCALYGDFLYDVAWLEFFAPWYPAIERGDIRDHARRHYDAIGLDVPDLDARMRCCALHIGLAHHGHSAYIGDMHHLTAIADRTRTYLD